MIDYLSFHFRYNPYSAIRNLECSPFQQPLIDQACYAVAVISTYR